MGWPSQLEGAKRDIESLEVRGGWPGGYLLGPASYMVGSPCDFGVIPSPNCTFGFGTAIDLGLGFGLGGLEFRLGLDNNSDNDTGQRI